MNKSQEIELTVKDLIKKNLKVKNSLSNSKIKTGLQHFLSLKVKEPYKSYYDSIVSSALRAEKICPGGGMVFLGSYTDSSIESSIEDRIENKKDLIELISKQNYSKSIENILIYSLDYLSISTKLSIRKSSTIQSYVELTEGYNFEVKTLFKIFPTEISNTKIICIDGYIESVSEIHHILEWLSEKKSSCIIFSRGMSNDVIHTLKVNHDRKTLFVYPYLVPYDLENVNTLVDIAVVSGTDVISSLKGNLISSISLEDIKEIEKCTISENSIRIKNSASKLRVKYHIESLKKQIEEKQNIEDILSKRLRSLSSSCLDFYIPDDINFLSKSQQLDEGIRIISSILNKNYLLKETVSSILKSHQKNFGDTFLFTLEEK